MKIKKIFPVCMSMLLFIVSGCGKAGGEQMSSTINSLSNAFVSSMSSALSPSTHVDSLPQAGLKISEPLFDISMVTNKLGYAITKSLHVLKTENGWADWIDLLSLDDSQNHMGKPALFTLGDKTIYTASFTESGISVERSADEGKNWSESLIEMQTDNADSGYGGSLSLSFVNASKGFLLTSGLPTGGMMKKILYQTLDGGKSWAPVDNSKSKIEGYTTGMTFFSLNTGFVTCTYHGQTDIPIYRSPDKGRSWKMISLPVPEKVIASDQERRYADVYPPVIYGSENKNSKMELLFFDGEEHCPYIYSSNDEGVSWNIDGISNRFLVKYTFTDENNGFGIDENGVIYRTENGGITWR